MTGILIYNNDVVLADGLIAIGEIDAQICEVVLNSSRGEFKELPTLGGEAIKMLNGNINPMWCTLVKKQLESIGIPVVSIEMHESEINVRLKQ